MHSTVFLYLQKFLMVMIRGTLITILSCTFRPVPETAMKFVGS